MPDPTTGPGTPDELEAATIGEGLIEQERQRARDAADGTFTTLEDAAARPGATVVESVQHPSRREVAAAAQLLDAAIEQSLRPQRSSTIAGKREELEEALEDLRNAARAAHGLLT
jgi:hypothetical protein